jgi:hypothetical protein
MKILFDNIVLDSVLSSINASLNYSASNLQDQILYKRYQSSIDIDTITIAFSEDLDVSVFYYGLTNATSLVLRLYDSSDVLLHTETISSPNLVTDAVYFTSVFAASAEIDIVGSATGVYLGGVALGVSEEFPDPDGEWPEDFEDNSFVTTSPEGQSLQNYVEPLRIHNFRFTDLTRDRMNDIMDLYRLTGIGLPIWFDPFEDNHDFMMPLYAAFTRPIRSTKNGRRYNFSIAIKEAR